MTVGETELYNIAVAECGGRGKIASPTEASREAQLCNQHYEEIRRLVLSSAHWPSARKVARLAIQKERDETENWVVGDPEPGYCFAYEWPSDCLQPRFLSSFQLFEVGITGDHKTILSNAENAVLIYTFDNKNIGMWDPALRWAVAYALAAAICQGLTGKTNLSRSVQEKANDLINQARENTSNVGDRYLDAIPDWISARGFALSHRPQQFIYPFGPLIQHVGPVANVK